MKVKEAFPGYAKPSIALDLVLLRTGKEQDGPEDLTPRKIEVMLVQNRECDAGADNEWHLPGTILRLGETPEDAIKRILAIETDSVNVYFEQLYTVADNPLRDDRGHIISLVYIGIANSEAPINMINNDRFSTKWFTIRQEIGAGKVSRVLELVDKVSRYTTTDLKYDHMQIINDTINKIQGRLGYTNIGFKFVPEEFTLTQLENTFRALKEGEIPNFRRQISKYVEGQKKYIAGRSNRPTELYKEKR